MVCSIVTLVSILGYFVTSALGGKTDNWAWWFKVVSREIGTPASCPPLFTVCQCVWLVNWRETGKEQAGTG